MCRSQYNICIVTDLTIIIIIVAVIVCLYAIIIIYYYYYVLLLSKTISIDKINNLIFEKNHFKLLVTHIVTIDTSRERVKDDGVYVSCFIKSTMKNLSSLSYKTVHQEG